LKRGDIYLVNFSKKYNSEFGKIRPAVVIQNDIANRNIDKVDFKGITVAPLTTRLYSSSVRLRVQARDALMQTSDICINEICTLDMSRFDLTKCLTKLTEKELLVMQQQLRTHLSL